MGHNDNDGKDMQNRHRQGSLYNTRLDQTIPQTTQGESKNSNNHKNTIILILVFLLGVLTASLVFCILFFPVRNRKKDESDLHSESSAETQAYSTEADEPALPAETGETEVTKVTEVTEVTDDSGSKKMTSLYLDTCPIIESASYQGNMGDSFIDVIGTNQYTRGNRSIDGTIYTHGIEAWIARWNELSEISWAYAVFDLEPGYHSLSGNVTLIESYNTDHFDSTLYFYDGDRLIDSFLLNPQSIPFEFNIDISDVDALKILVEDNTAVEGGTSFGIVDTVLSTEVK